jgi:hypothetical protein
MSCSLPRARSRHTSAQPGRRRRAEPPSSIYAESKTIIEKILPSYGVTNSINSVSLRCFNAAGASLDGRIGEDWTYSCNLIPLPMKAVLLDDYELKVFGDDYDTPGSTCIRDYIHVEDLADAHVMALNYLGNGASRLQSTSGSEPAHLRRDQRHCMCCSAPGRSQSRRSPHRRPGIDLCEPLPRARNARLVCPARARRHCPDCLRLAPQPTQRQSLNDDRTAKACGLSVRQSRQPDAPSSTASGQASPAAPRQLAGRGADDDRPRRTD